MGGKNRDDSELRAVATQGLMLSPEPRSKASFPGDFRAELARYLYEQRMGVRAEFVAQGAPLPNAVLYQERPLCRVEVPPHLATSWLVTLSSPNYVGGTTGAGPADVLRLFARMSLGLAGMVTQVEVDWRQGSRFEVTGASVDIVAVLPAQSLGTPPTGFPLTISASIAPGVCTGALPVTRTVYYGTIDGGVSVTLPVPRFARRVFFARNNPSIFAWTANWARDGGATLTQYQTYTNATARNYGDIMHPLNVPPDATALRILNNEPPLTFLTDFVAIYELAL